MHRENTHTCVAVQWLVLYYRWLTLFFPVKNLIQFHSIFFPSLSTPTDVGPASQFGNCCFSETGRTTSNFIWVISAVILIGYRPCKWLFIKNASWHRHTQKGDTYVFILKRQKHLCHLSICLKCLRWFYPVQIKFLGGKMQNILQEYNQHLKKWGLNL